MDLVIGSGPAGVAAALALLERGRTVTLLDVGRRIEPEFAALPARLAGLEYEAWPADARRALAGIVGPLDDGFPMKTNFGSDFAYRRDPALMPVELRDASILVSLARGGLSNLWGANAFSFCDDDLRDWPIRESDLAPAYRAVLRHVPLSATSGDGLEALMPLHTEQLEERPLSAQAVQLLGDLERDRVALAARGVTFGPSRLGLRTSRSERDPGCVRCGFCMHGCPHDLIYCSSQTLAQLERHPRFRYEDDAYVTRFVEGAGAVEVIARRAGGEARWTGERAFIACGGFSTARLVLESLERYEQEALMLESQYFLIPMLQWRSFPGAATERLTALSQVCLRVRDADVCARDVHMLIYTYNPLYEPVVRATPARFVPGLMPALLSRLLSLQGYLHSDVSPRLALSLRRGADSAPTLVVAGRTNPATRPAVARVAARVRSLASSLRATPVPFMTRVGKPGKSYHSGGTFPMRREPKAMETDLLGRPAGLKRVHVVDSSVFPTVPATNLTLTVMANAYRIASEAAGIEADAPERAR